MPFKPFVVSLNRLGTSTHPLVFQTLYADTVIDGGLKDKISEVWNSYVCDGINTGQRHNHLFELQTNVIAMQAFPSIQNTKQEG